MYTALPGDILLYRKNPSLADILIDIGERIEDGPQPDEYHHCSIALDANSKIEAYGSSVAIHKIDYGNFDAFRPPIDQHHIDLGLSTVKKYVGQPYDWWAVIDDGLRYVSRNLIHLPVSFVQSEERKGKVCSTLVVQYFNAAVWGPNLGLNTSPEDIYLAVKYYSVS